MIRAIAFALLLACLAACTATLDTTATAAESPLCDAVMPKLIPWDGNAFTLTTEMTGIHICESPSEPTHLWAFVVDGDQVTAKVDIKPEQLAQFFQLVLGPSQSSVASAPPNVIAKKALYTTNIVCKGDPGTRPMIRAAQAELPSIDPDNAPHLIYRTRLLYDAIARAEKDIATGQVCDGK
jgi:hypothetical protein